MAFSVSNPRSRSQDSPTFWLSLVAGSLALHLVILLLGRWYLSQTATVPAGNSQAPLDFVEIDPNAPSLKDAKPIAPSASSTAPLPKVAPPQPEAATPEQNQQTSIEKLTRQATPESVTTPSDPVKPEQEKPRSQPGQLPTEPTTPKRNSTTPSSVATPTPKLPGTTPSSTQTPGTPTPGTPTPGTPSTPIPGSPGTPAPETPNTPTPGSPGTPAGSGNGLSIATGVRGEVRGSLQEDTYRPEQYARGSVTLKSASLPSISFDYPTKLPVKVLDLRLGLLIGADGAVTATVRNDSPTLKAYPNIENDVKSIVDQLIPSALADKSLAFNINLESSKVDAYRIMDIRIYVSQ